MKLRVLLYCLLGGVPLTIASLGAGHLVWWWLSRALLAASLVPVALFGPQKTSGQFGAIIPVLLIVTILCTFSEALIFFPGYGQRAGRDLFSSVVMYLIVAEGQSLVHHWHDNSEVNRPGCQARLSPRTTEIIPHTRGGSDAEDSKKYDPKRLRRWRASQFRGRNPARR